MDGARGTSSPMKINGMSNKDNKYKKKIEQIFIERIALKEKVVVQIKQNRRQNYGYNRRYLKMYREFAEFRIGS